MVPIALAYAVPRRCGSTPFRTSLTLHPRLGCVEDVKLRVNEKEEGAYLANAVRALLWLRDELNAIALLPNHFFCIASRTSAPTPGE